MHRQQGFTPEYLLYCLENGFEGDPQGMLAADRERYGANVSSKRMYGAATGFMVWRQERVESGIKVVVEKEEKRKVVPTSGSHKQKPVQQTLFDF